MTADQWATIITQAGIGGAVLLVVIYVIVPMFRDESRRLGAAIRDLATPLRDLVASTDKNTNAVSALGERVSRLEGMLDYVERDPRRAEGAGGRVHHLTPVPKKDP